MSPVCDSVSLSIWTFSLIMFTYIYHTLMQQFNISAINHVMKEGQFSSAFSVATFKLEGVVAPGRSRPRAATSVAMRQR